MNISNFIEENKHLKIAKWKTPQTGYVYFVCEKDGLIIYIGTTMNIYARFKVHSLRIEFHKKPFFFFSAPKEECLELEQKLILEIKPKFNTEWVSGRKNKVYKPTKKEITRRKRMAQKDSKERKKIILGIMDKKNINQSDLAMGMNVSRQRVEQMLNGYNYPNGKTIKKLEHALKTKLNVGISSRPWKRDIY